MRKPNNHVWRYLWGDKDDSEKSKLRWYSIRDEHMIMFGHKQAMFLSKVMDMTSTMDLDENRSVACSQKELHKLGWKPETQLEYFALFESLGIVRITYRGVPRRRYVYVDTEALRRTESCFKSNGRCLSPSGDNKLSPTRVNIYKEDNIKKEERSSPTSSSRTSEGYSMFIDKPEYTKKTTKKTTPLKIDEVWADQLREKIVSLFMATKKGNTITWANEFRKLREITCNGEMLDIILTIQELLDWYCSYADKDFKPKIRSAKEFRDQFIRLSDNKEKYDKANPKIKISKETKQILSYLSTNWPKGITRKQLGATVERTLNAARGFFRKLNKQEGSFANYVRDYFVDPVKFTHKWFDRVYDSIKNWKEWRGKISNWGWDGNLKNEMFKKLLYSSAEGWSVDLNGDIRDLIRDLRDR